jgi:XTP/dITP diphosphohydrolase
MKTLLLATNNKKKAQELRDITQSTFEVKTLADVGLGGDSAVDVVEDAPDFAGNAWKKADAVAAAAAARGLAVDVVVADDSGLIVDALDGHPGVRSARFAADGGYAPAGLDKDAANNRLLLTLLAPVPDERRGARFTAVVVARDLAGGVRHAAQGFVEGRIARDERGGGGFGYDPLFVVTDKGAPDDVRGQRMAALTAQQKHAISHRGRAMAQLLKQLMTDG